MVWVLILLSVPWALLATQMYENSTSSPPIPWQDSSSASGRLAMSNLISSPSPVGSPSPSPVGSPSPSPVGSPSPSPSPVGSPSPSPSPSASLASLPSLPAVSLSADSSSISSAPSLLLLPPHAAAPSTSPSEIKHRGYWRIPAVYARSRRLRTRNGAGAPRPSPRPAGVWVVQASGFSNSGGLPRSIALTPIALLLMVRLSAARTSSIADPSAHGSALISSTVRAIS